MLCLCTPETIIRILEAPNIVKTEGYDHVLSFTCADELTPENVFCVHLALTDDQLKQLSAYLVIYQNPVK